MLHDTEVELGDDPGLEKDGVEAELQQLIAARVAVLREDFVLVRREFPTDIGPIDLLCRDGDGRAVVVEVKRVGEIAGVDQLLRYQERLDRDPQFAPTTGMLVAQQIKPQARVYAREQGRRVRGSEPGAPARRRRPRPEAVLSDRCVRAVLLLQCGDRPGIVAAVGAFVAEAGGNVVEADQHSDPTAGLFLQRVEFEVDAPLDGVARRLHSHRGSLLDGLVAARSRRAAARRRARVPSGPLPRRPARTRRARRARRRGGARRVEPRHARCARRALRRALPPPPGRRRLPGGPRRAGTSRSARCSMTRPRDVVVLARYMRVLPPWLVDGWSQRMINIHHSFLPSFAGARPYAQAHERGVKVIGATAHYVTPELDEGPIIAQQVLPVSHRDDPNRLERRGRDLEAVVLAEAAPAPSRAPGDRLRPPHRRVRLNAAERARPASVNRQVRARFANLVYCSRNASRDEPVGPFRCLATMISAMPRCSDSGL